MGLLTNIFKRNLSLTDKKAWDSSYWNLIGAQSSAGVNVTYDKALSSSAVFNAIALLSGTIGGLPLNLYQKKANQGNVVEDRRPLHQLLHFSPNPEMSAMTFRETMTAHVLGWGNCYAEIQRNGMGEVTGLWPIPPNRVVMRRINGELIYEVKVGSETIPLPRDRMLHIPGLGFDGIQGYSVISYARETIGLGLAMEEFGARFFGAGTHPGAVAQHPSKLGDVAYDNLKKSLTEQYSGLGQSHKLLILEEGMEIKQIGIPPEDAQFLESRVFSVNEIARWFNVPPHKLKELTHATYCLPATEEVFTEGGPKSIADVKPGEKVWSINGNGLELSTVKHSVCSGEDKILEIKTTNRTIKANPRHPILTRKKYPDAKSGIGGYQSIKWVNEYVPAGELKKGDTIIVADHLPDIIGNGKCPTRELSEGFMEFCGLLLGDGNVNKGWGVTIARAEDALYMDHYREVMKNEFKSFKKNGNGGHRKGELNSVRLSEGHRQTRFASVLAAEELERLGFCGNARTKRVPSWVFGLKEKYRFAIIRGYLDADGSVDEKGRITFHSVNKEMLSQFRHLCISLGIPVTNYYKKEGIGKLPNGKAIDYKIYAFTCSDPEANRAIWSHDVRYQKRFMNGKPFDRKGRKYPRFGGNGFDLAGCSLARISSIEELDIQPVYDLMVEDTHSFIANGVIVHNTNIEHQSIEFVIDSVLPWLVRFEQGYDLQLLSPKERKRKLYFKHIVEGLLRGDAESRGKFYNQMFMIGAMTINEIRAKEDMNPTKNGDEQFVPMNMVPLSRALEPPPPPPPIPDIGNEPAEPEEIIEEERSIPQYRSIRERNSIQKSYHKLFVSTSQRFIEKETKAVKVAANKLLTQRTKAQFSKWLENYYETFGKTIEKDMLPLLMTYAEDIERAANNEIGVKPEMTPELAEFVRQYNETFSLRHTSSSLGQLQAILRDTEPDEMRDAIDTRVGEWQEKSPEKIASNETVRANNAVAKFVFIAGGITKLMWVTQGSKSCPYCQNLNGKIVGVEYPFIGEGLFNPKGADGSMKIRGPHFAPPLHQGCICGISAT